MCRKKIGIILMVGLFASSCATIIQGNTKKVHLISHTPGTEIYVDNYLRGVDVVTLKLRRKKDHHILFKKQGYESISLILNSKFQIGWIILYAVWFGVNVYSGLWPYTLLNGWIDLSTGSMYTFDRNKIMVELEKKEIPSSNYFKTQ